MAKALQIVKTLYQQALNNEHCDVKITCQGKIYGAHKGVLIQASDYFKYLFSGHFKEGRDGEVCFDAMCKTVGMCEAILEYIYLGEFHLEDHSPEDVLHVTSMLGLVELLVSTNQYLLENLTLENVLYTWSWARLFNLETLEEVCRAFCRSRFHDYIIHQPDTIKLPLDYLCHFIREGMMEFVDDYEQLTFLQNWALYHTKEQHFLWDTHIIEGLIGGFGEFETKIVTVLQEPNFLNRQLSREMRPDKTDVILGVEDTEEKNSKCIYFCDFYHGKWYKSRSFHVPDDFNRFLAIIGNFAVYQRSFTETILAVDSQTGIGTEVLLPNYAFKESQCIFAFEEQVFLLVSMAGWADATCETHTYETAIREGNGESSSNYHTTAGANKCDDKVDAYDKKDEPQPSTSSADVPPVLSSPLLDAETLDDFFSIFDSNSQLESTNRPKERKTPLDLTFETNASANKLCLFRLVTECCCNKQIDVVLDDQRTVPAVTPCDACKPRWELQTSIHTDLNLILKSYDRNLINGRFCVMAKGDTKSDQNEVKTTQYVWFYISGNCDSGGQYQIWVPPPPPTQRTNRSRMVEWEKVKIVDIKGNFGLRSFKSPVKYSIYFDVEGWRWKWVPYHTEFDKHAAAHPKPILLSLPIKLKSSKFQYTSINHPVRISSDLDNYDFATSSHYPSLRQFWQYRKSEDNEGWTELQPPPCDPGRRYKRMAIEQSVLLHLEPILPNPIPVKDKEDESATDDTLQSETWERPFEDWEFKDRSDN